MEPKDPWSVQGSRLNHQPFKNLFGLDEKGLDVAFPGNGLPRMLSARSRDDASSQQDREPPPGVAQPAVAHDDLGSLLDEEFIKYPMEQPKLGDELELTGSSNWLRFG